MNELRAPFHHRAAYAPPDRYRLTPFRIHAMGSQYLLMNEVGEYTRLPLAELEA